MTTYKIHPIVMGSKIFDKTMMTYQHGYGVAYTIPIYTWYIEVGQENAPPKTILIDTGEAAPVRTDSREKALGAKVYTFGEGLAKWGLKPDDIDVIIHTHLHNDHCENDDKCPNAEIYVHEKELLRIHNPHPLDFRYMEDYIADAEQNGRINAVARDMEILPGINVIHTPAHTEGGMSIAITTASGLAVITGFCCIMDNFNPPPEIRGMEMEVIPPGTHVNVYEAYDIMLRVKTLGDILIPLHEPKFAQVETVG